MQAHNKKKNSKWQLFKILFGKENNEEDNQNCGCGCGSKENEEEVISCCAAPETDNFEDIKKKLNNNVKYQGCGCGSSDNEEEKISCCAAPESDNFENIKTKINNKVEYQSCGCGSNDQTTSCCSSTETDSADTTDMTFVQDELSSLSEKMYELSLSGSDIIEAADIQPHETVLALGSGGGTICFQAARNIRSEGKVIGVDMDPEMVELARSNAKKLGFQNIEFLEGDIENLPVPEISVDIIISCNISAMSKKINPGFADLYRVLKPGGRLYIVDTMIQGNITGSIRDTIKTAGGRGAELMTEDEYRSKIHNAGFIKAENMNSNDSCSCGCNEAQGTGTAVETKTIAFKINITKIRALKPEYTPN